MSYFVPYSDNRIVGKESAKAYRQRWRDGFWGRYVRGPVILDIGWRGGVADAQPIIDGAVGIDLDTPGYDGLTLPYPNNSVDVVHSSHVFEHLIDPIAHLIEWFRVLKPHGHIIMFVPHAYLYERRTKLPSRWSGEHLHIFTPASLLQTVQTALIPNTYRIVHFKDNDDGYDYSLPPDAHPEGCLEMELVLRKIDPPAWRVET